jgi:hypothetical protein
MLGNISKTRSSYKSIIVIFSALFLFGSSGMVEQMCQDMMVQTPATEHSDMPDCPTKKGDAEMPMDSDDHCSSELICECAPNIVSIKDSKIVVNKMEVSQLYLVVVELVEPPTTEIQYQTLSHPKLYSSPPLFLTNESFLILKKVPHSIPEVCSINIARRLLVVHYNIGLSNDRVFASEIVFNAKN